MDIFSSEYPDGDLKGEEVLVVSIWIVFKAKRSVAHSLGEREVKKSNYLAQRNNNIEQR